MYKTKIYISEVTNLSDARFAAGMLVDFIGFPIDETSVKHIDLMTFAAIQGWIEGIEIVGEFNDLPLEKINSIISNYNIRYVSLPISRLEEIEKINAQVFILSDEEINSQSSNLYSIVSENCLNQNHFNCNFKTNTIEEILTAENLQGVVLKGGEEERPGVKDYDEIADILELLEE